MSIDQHAPGAKLDTGKPRCGLVLGAFALALTEVSKVGTFGANKYSDNGWLSVENGQQRYADALFRHLLSNAAGEAADPDSGLLHKAHAAWNALAILELELRAVKAAKVEWPAEKKLYDVGADTDTPGAITWVKNLDQVRKSGVMDCAVRPAALDDVCPHDPTCVRYL